MLNIALTFKQSDNLKLNSISNQLHKKGESVYILGKNSIPHISLTHIEGEKEDAEKMWELLIKKGIDTNFKVVLGSFYIDAPTNDGKVYTGFNMEEFGKLSKLQELILKTFPNKTIYNDYGRYFNPHITTSCHLNLKNKGSFKAPFKRIEAFLTIGTRDSYGRMENILITANKG